MDLMSNLDEKLWQNSEPESVAGNDDSKKPITYWWGQAKRSDAKRQNRGRHFTSLA